MENILLVIQVVTAAALIGMVLIQRSDTDGFGLGSGGGGANLLSGRAKANLLTRTTGILAAIFIINSLILSVIAVHAHRSNVLEMLDKEKTTTTAPAPAAPESAPLVPTPGAEKAKAAAEVTAPGTVPAPAAAPVIKHPRKHVAPAVPAEALPKAPAASDAGSNDDAKTE